MILLSLGVVLLELLFGAWLRPQSLNRLNLIKDQRLTYNVSGLYATNTPMITYSRDHYGLRGTYGQDPARIDLLTVGGSTTDQRYISDEATWQAVLQQRFAAQGKPLLVANAGVDGQSTFGHIKNFDWWFPYIPGLKPRYILFYVGLNDFYRARDDSRFDTLRQHAVLVLIEEHSALWHLFRTTRGTYQATKVLRIGHRKIDFHTVSWTSLPQQHDYRFLAPRLEAYTQRLRILVDTTRRFGAQPLFVTQPARYYRLTQEGLQGQAEVSTYEGRQINGVDHYIMMQQFDHTMAKVCRATQVRCLDLAATSAWDDSDFYDFSHMTPRGTHALGLHLFAWLQTFIQESGTPPTTTPD